MNRYRAFLINGRVLSLTIILTISAFCSRVYAQNDRTESGVSHYTVYYPNNGYVIDEQVKSQNVQTFVGLDNFLKEYIRNYSADSIRVKMTILASTSIDNGWYYNKRLAERRSVAMRNYLYENYPEIVDHQIELIILGEDWDGLKRLSEADPNIPDRDKLIVLISDSDANPDDKTEAIRTLSGGTTFRYLMKNVMPQLRYVKISFPNSTPAEVDAEPIAKSEPEPIAEPESEPEIDLSDEEPGVIVYDLDWGDEPIPFERFWSIKTNILFLGVGVLNAAVEFPVGDRFSIDIPVTFSPYKITESWRIKTSIIQPEFRWWLNQQMTGHFVGAHAHFGYYNVSLDNENRYQDKDGNSPLWGFGASYGYAMPIKQRWGIEFTLGLGYARLNYDVFYNVPNGALYDTRQKNHWGITRAGVSLIYKFNLQKHTE